MKPVNQAHDALRAHSLINRGLYVGRITVRHCKTQGILQSCSCRPDNISLKICLKGIRISRKIISAFPCKRIRIGFGS